MSDPKQAFVNDLAEQLVAINNASPRLPSKEEIAAAIQQKLEAHWATLTKARLGPFDLLSTHYCALKGWTSVDYSSLPIRDEI